MKKNNILNSTIVLKLALMTLVVAVTFTSAASLSIAQVKPSGDSYEWSAELVSFDSTSRSMTVKTYVVGENAPAEIAKLKAGEKIMLTWSGVDRYTSGITHAVAYSVAKTSERFTLPVEFVSYDSTQKYMTFKTQVPAAGVDKIKNLKPGEWVTATSIHGKATETQPIVSIRPYVIQPNESTHSN
jgi:hypothetical protein